MGGAATAAQMASTMTQRDSDGDGDGDGDDSVNLILAASTMGTIGYIIGTPIGLFLAKILSGS